MRRDSRNQRGFSLIELMVALVIASLLALAVTSVLATFEARKQAMASVNDVNQSGNYAAWVIDDLLRSAGSGFAQTAGFSFGCQLLAAKNGNTILPAPAPLNAPFASLGQNFRLAPALIVGGGTTPGDSGIASDALVVMGGAGGRSEMPVYFENYIGGPPSYLASNFEAALPLKNTLAFGANDIVLFVDRDISTAMSCIFSQVDGTFTENGGTDLPLKGTYYQLEFGTYGTPSYQNIVNYSRKAVALNLGNAIRGNPPAFKVLGVGNNSTLYAYDLLQLSDSAPQALAAGVFEMHALYGIDSNNDKRIDAWVKPEASYSYATLTSGSSAAAETIRQIKAIRVGLIMRTALKEKEKVSQDSLSLFSDLGPNLSYNRSLAGDSTKYRYRTLEFSVPLRNAMMVE